METFTIPKLLLNTTNAHYRQIGEFAISLFEDTHKVCEDCEKDANSYGEISHNKFHDWVCRITYRVTVNIAEHSTHKGLETLFRQIVHAEIKDAGKDFRTIEKIAIRLTSDN